MKRKMIFIGIVILICCISCSENKIAEKSESVFSSLLPEGKHLFEVLDSIERTHRQIELEKLIQLAMQNDMDAFTIYFEKTKNKQEAKFPNGHGLTEEDFKEYMQYSSNIKLLPSGAQEVTVQYSDNKIKFQSKGKLELLNYLEIDLEKNIVRIDKYILPFKDSIEVNGRSNALQESWKGQIWEYVDAKDIDKIDNITYENIKNLSATRYKFTLGVLKDTNKTFMIIKGQEFSGGEKLVSFEIPIRMK